MEVMFDAHCHMGLAYSDAIVCTSRTDEYGAVSSYPLHSFGILRKDGGDLRLLVQALENDKKAMVGEFGLDSRFNEGDELFLSQLKLAKDLARPFTLHVVHRHSEVIRALKKIKPACPFIVHGYTSSAQLAAEYARLGGFISLSPLSARTRDYEKLLALPFLLESDMPLSAESLAVLDSWYEKAASDMKTERERLEEMINERKAVFTT